MNNLITLIFAASLIFSATATPKKSGKKFVWKFVTENDSEDDASERWREEANYWYDECAWQNNEADNMPLQEKVDLLEKNNDLEFDNKLLEKKINQIYPDIAKLNKNELKTQINELETILAMPETNTTLIEQEKKSLLLDKKIEQLTTENADLKKLCLEKGYINEIMVCRPKIQLIIDDLSAEKRILELKLKKLQYQADLLTREPSTLQEICDKQALIIKNKDQEIAAWKAADKLEREKLYQIQVDIDEGLAKINKKTTQSSLKDESKRQSKKKP